MFFNFFAFMLGFELFFMPLAMLFDLGFSSINDSAYLARFSYIACFIFSFFHFFLYFSKSRLFFIQIVFLLIGLVGAVNGLLSNGFNSYFFSHMFYYLMPSLALYFGFHLGHYLDKNPRDLIRFKKIIVLAFWFGLAVVVMFKVASYLGFARYNAIGIWAVVFGGPLIYSNSPWGIFWVVLVCVLAAKSTVLVSVISVWLLYALSRSFALRTYIFLSVVLLIFIVCLLYLSQIDIFASLPEHRFIKALEAMVRGDFNLASSGRWEESSSMLKSLGDSWLFGRGFGAYFIPWDASPDYNSHYVHFGNLTWLYTTGILGYFLIFGAILFCLLKFIARIFLNPREDLRTYVLLVCCSIIVLSLFGAILMNNFFCWAFLGWGLYILTTPKQQFKIEVVHK